MKNKLHTSKVNFRVLHNTSVPNQYEVRVNGNPQQMDVQNLSGCYATVFWVVGPYITLESIRDVSRVFFRP